MVPDQIRTGQDTRQAVIAVGETAFRGDPDVVDAERQAPDHTIATTMTSLHSLTDTTLVTRSLTTVARANALR